MLLVPIKKINLVEISQLYFKICFNVDIGPDDVTNQITKTIIAFSSDFPKKSTVKFKNTSEQLPLESVFSSTSRLNISELIFAETVYTPVVRVDL